MIDRYEGGTELDKNILDQYIDACELVKETEIEILRLENMQVQMAQDSVTGSNPDYPYEQRRFKIEGVIFSCGDAVRLDRQRKILEQRRQQASKIKQEVEQWMNSLPVRMQRIIQYHFFQGMTWSETAKRIGRKTTAESVRKEFERFFEK
jgi:DNA-directed RNA polymerase specialized sigma subunit